MSKHTTKIWKPARIASDPASGPTSDPASDPSSDPASDPASNPASDPAIFKNGRQSFHQNQAIFSLFLDEFGHAVHEFNVF